MDNSTESPALLASSGKMTTMADGTLRITFDVDPGYKQAAFRMFGDPGTPAAIARLKGEAATEATRPRHAFGKEAEQLYLSGFFRVKSVWQCIGTPDDYSRWVRGQRCCFAHAECHGDIVAAHVRRIAYGAGTGIKPPYAEIPMCDAHHRQQHQEGETSLAPRDKFEALRVEYVERWARETLKAQLGYESWADVPPHVVREWASRHSLEGVIPSGFGGADTKGL